MDFVITAGEIGQNGGYSGELGGAPPGKAHPARRLFKRLRKPPHRLRPWTRGESRPHGGWTGTNR
jgi:hypothetical protein